VIVEPPAVPAQRVGSAVRREWGVEVTAAEHVEVGSHGWHWLLGDDGGVQWFATLEQVRSSDERRTRIAALEAAGAMARGLPFAVPPVLTRDARVAVDLAPGLLLTLTPYVDGATVGTGPFEDDTGRVEVAHLLGELHRQARPRQLPRWRPRIGRQGETGAEDLQRCLELEVWTGGPWSVPAGHLLAASGTLVRRCVRRFSLLAAAVSGNAERWVVTHGAPHTGNLMHTPDGPRLLDWGAVALAPRERDLRQVLGEAEGHEPWFAYVESGGLPDPLSPAAVELFALQWHLTRITDGAVRFSRPHPEGADERQAFAELEEELALLARWT